MGLSEKNPKSHVLSSLFLWNCHCMDIPYHVYPIFRHTHLAPWVGTIACPSSTQFFFLSCCSCLTLKYLKYETRCGIALLALWYWHSCPKKSSRGLGLWRSMDSKRRESSVDLSENSGFEEKYGHADNQRKTLTWDDDLASVECSHRFVRSAHLGSDPYFSGDLLM